MKKLKSQIDVQLESFDRAVPPAIPNSRSHIESRLEVMEHIYANFSGNTKERERLELLKREIDYSHQLLKPNAWVSWLRWAADFMLDNLRKLNQNIRSRIEGGFDNDNIGNKYTADYISKGLDFKEKELNRAAYFKKDSYKESLISQVERDLIKKGYLVKLSKEHIAAIYGNEKLFKVGVSKDVGGRQLASEITYERSGLTGRYYATEMEATIRNIPSITDRRINNVDINELRYKLKNTLALQDYYTNHALLKDNPAYKVRLDKEWPGINNLLEQLRTGTDAKGKEVYDQIVYKDIAHSKASDLIPDLERIRKKFEVTAVVKIDPVRGAFTPDQLSNLLEGRAVKSPVDRTWYRLHNLNGENQGSRYIGKVEGSENYSVEVALFKHHVMAVAGEKLSDLVKGLENGDALDASILHSDSKRIKVIYAEPGSNDIKVDWGKSADKGYYDTRNYEKILKLARNDGPKSVSIEKSLPPEVTQKKRSPVHSVEKDTKEARKEVSRIYIEYPAASAISHGRQR